MSVPSVSLLKRLRDDAIFEIKLDEVGGAEIIEFSDWDRTFPLTIQEMGDLTLELTKVYEEMWKRKST